LLRSNRQFEGLLRRSPSRQILKSIGGGKKGSKKSFASPIYAGGIQEKLVQNKAGSGGEKDRTPSKGSITIERNKKGRNDLEKHKVAPNVNQLRK